MAGESLEIIGCNADYSWWQVAIPNGFGWVSASVNSARWLRISMSRIDDLRRQIDLYYRRLQKLEEQRAIKGISADPSLLIEIEDIEKQIKKLESNLQTLSTSDSEDVFHAPNAGNKKEFSTNSPLSFANIAAGIIVTVIGGLILAYILQDAKFAPSSGLSVSSVLTPVPTDTTTATPTEIPPTSTPMDTATPTRLSTPTVPKPSPMPTTVALISTPTPLPTFTPSCSTPTYFQDVWEIRPQLGCPTSTLTSDFTYQTFERGIFAWQKSPSPSTIYILLANGRWEKISDPGGPPSPSCKEAEQTGGLGPIFGFGTVWCNIQNIRDQIGAPTSAETDGKNNQIQNFENGSVLTIGMGKTIILYSNSQWESF